MRENCTYGSMRRPAYRLGAYFFGGDVFDNSASGGFARLETYAALAQADADGNDADDLVSSVTEQVYVAQSPEAFAYDADGNQTLVQTATGIWQVQYNGENRPVLWENVSTNSPTFNSTTPSLISMSYDHMGRRRTKDGQRFFYDGYLQVANERTVSNAVVRQSFVWDPTEPVATRPLAWLCSNAPPRLYTHDGNKNVSEVVVAASGTNTAVEVVAHYDYAAFGAVIAQKGGCAETNPWRFSSEYEDTELGLDYYNYRHYEPVTGRWMSRDPIEDFGSLIVAYGFVSNSPIGDFDWIGYISLSEFVLEYVNSSLGVDFSIPLLGPTGIPMPMIPGCPRAQIHIVISGEKRWCCNGSSREVYYKGSIGVEAYLVWGYGSKRPFKGRDRNKPDPERPGSKIKDHDDHPKDSGYRSRDGHFDGNVGVLRDCPESGMHWDGFTGAVFLRGSIGCGFAGLQANVQINIAENMDLASLFSGSWSLAHTVYGATIEFGGGGHGNWTYK